MTRKVAFITGLLIFIALCLVLIDRSDKKQAAPSRAIQNQATPFSEPNPYVDKLLHEYESEIANLRKTTGTPGVAVAIVHDTSILYLKTFGVREVGKPDSVNEHTVFRLASVSKCFAPMLTGLLVQDGVLAWDDAVIKYLPDFSLKEREHTEKLTIRHILSHTTGLPYHTYTTLVEDGRDLKTMIDELKNVNLIGKPGEVYSYQNVAYSIIAEVIKAATGKTYEQLMYERIFKPLHMENASLSYQDIVQNANVAKPHHQWRKGWKITSIKNTYYNVSPAGGINASITDMANWLKSMLGSRQDFISNTTLHQIFKPAIKAKAKNRNFKKLLDRAESYYAMGWRVLDFKTDTLLYHGGYVNGYRSEVAIHRSSKIAICVLSNGPGKLIDTSVPIFFNLYFDQRDSIQSWENNQANKTSLQVKHTP